MGIGRIGIYAADLDQDGQEGNHHQCSLGPFW